MTKKIFYVDIPNYLQIDNKEIVEKEWINMNTFDTREEAIKYIQENIDSSSKDGTVSLISEDEQEI